MVHRRAIALAIAGGLLVSACAQEPQLPTIDAVIESSAALGTLATAQQAAGLDAALNRGGPYTVFAPQDAAFSALPAGVLETLLLPENRDELERILAAHVVSGAYLAADLVDTTSELTTLDGTTLTVDGVEGIALTGAAGGRVAVVQPDLRARNGVIHVVDGILLP